jgi:hypothetical protein
MDLFLREKGLANLLAGSDVCLKQLCAMTTRKGLYMLKSSHFLGVNVEKQALPSRPEDFHVLYLSLHLGSRRVGGFNDDVCLMSTLS